MTNISITQKSNGVELVKTYYKDDGGLRAIAIYVPREMPIVEALWKLEEYYEKDKAK